MTPVQPTAAASCPFSRIVGQRRAVPFLREIRDGIRLGATPHPLLFLGRSGHGKSSLSKAFADSIGAEFVRIDCGPELKSEHLVEKLTGLQSLTVVFCDEFQSMRKRVQEVLYSAIDSKLVPRLERGRLDRCAAQVPIMSFVLIGATNEPGRLLPALRNRMVNVVMDEYSAADLRAIVVQKSKRFLLNLSDRTVELIVRASGGSPRNIVQILQSVEVTSASWRFGRDGFDPDDPARGRVQATDFTDDVPRDPDSPLADGSVLPGGCVTTSSNRRRPTFDLQRATPDELIEVPVGDLVGEPLVAPRGDPGQASVGDELGDRPAAGFRHGPRIPDELVERGLTWLGLDLAGLAATGRTLLATTASSGPKGRPAVAARAVERRRGASAVEPTLPASDRRGSPRT